MASPVLRILHVKGPVAAFLIDPQFYFYRSIPIPQIFSSDLVLQLIPNIDNWFQAQTHQRHSHRSFLDMASAFSDGLNHSYSLQDLEDICAQASATTKDLIVIKHLAAYNKIFWIEGLNPAKFEGYVDNIRKKFEKLRSGLGDDAFFNQLCRLLEFSNNNCPRYSPILEQFIKRLGRVASLPAYPVSKELDDEIRKAVISKVLEKRRSVFKGVPAEIQEKVKFLEDQ